MPLFWFPWVLNDWVARGIGLQVVIISCFGIGFRKETSMQWAIFGLAIDFCFRFIWGGNVSPLGAIAQMVAHFLPRRWTPGPPKQFATLCGICFAGLACALLLGIDGEGGEISGSVVLGMLIGAAALEAFLGFCVGCVMFSQILVRFGLIASEQVEKCDRIIPEVAAFSDFVEGRLDLAAPQEIVVPARGPNGEPSPIDFRYKTVSDDHRKQDFNPIKHLLFSDLMMVLGVAGLALVYKFGVDTINAPKALWVTIAIIAAVLFGLWIIAALIKCAFYYKRVLKMWFSPVEGTAIGSLPLCFLVFSALSLDDEYGLAEVLFWIGAPLSVLVLAFSIARLFALPHHEYPWNNPGLIINFVGPMVAAWLAQSIRTTTRSGMLYAGWFFWGLPFLLFVVVKASLFTRMSFRYDLDDRMKPSYTIIMGASAITTISYLALNQGEWDNFALFIYWTTIVEALVLVCLLVYNYFGRHAFDRAYWAFTFPLHLGTMASMLFYSQVSNGDAAQFIMYVFIILSSYATVQCGLMTILQCIRLRYFIAPYRWGPNSFNLVTHRAFEGAAAQLQQISARLSVENRKACQDFAALFEEMAFVHHHHAEQEDRVFFPALESIFPLARITETAGDEHERDRDIMEAMLGHCAVIRENPTAEAIQAIQANLPTLVQNIIGHIVTEEVHIQQLIRKYGSFKFLKTVSRAQWNHSPPSVWARIIPFVIKYAPFDDYRRRLLLALELFVPDWMERIGIWIHLSVPSEIVERLRDVIPSIHPLGLLPGGLHRYN